MNLSNVGYDFLNNAIQYKVNDYKLQLKNIEKTNAEKYNICLKIWEICEKQTLWDQGIYYLLESYNYDKTRIDGIYLLIKHYCCIGNNELAFSFYSLIQSYYENNTFLLKSVEYEFYLPYYMIIVTERIKNYDVGIKMFETIFKKKQLNIDTWWLKNLFTNLTFFIDKVQNPSFFRMCEEYLNLLYIYHNGLTFADTTMLLKYINTYLDKEKMIFFSELKEPIKNFIIDKNIESNKILIYTGFSYYQWNATYGKNNFMGGSERAITFLHDYFPKNMEIYISGDVIEEQFDNVKYIHLNNLDKLLKNTIFHAIIISRYIGFFEMYDSFLTKQVILWAHDTYFLPYNRSNNIDDSAIIDKRHELVDSCICLTEWHKNLFEKKYPLLKEKIKIIGNGIDFSLFPKYIQLNIASSRVKNRFIYSSNPNRGLKRLLELWSDITNLMPDAELKIVGQESDDAEIIELISRFSSVEYLGKKNPTELYEIMATIDIWLYPVTDFDETYCITALEVLYSNIVCIYYPVAGLKDTIGDYGIAVSKGNELNVLRDLSEYKKDEMRINGRKYAENCSWKKRTANWNSLLDL